MKILQVIPAIPGTRLEHRGVLYSALVENNYGERRVIPVYDAHSMNADEIVWAYQLWYEEAFGKQSAGIIDFYRDRL